MAIRRPPLLGQDQHLAIGVVEEALSHGGVCGINVDSHAFLRGGISVAANGDDSFDEIRWFCRDWQRIPAHLIRRGWRLVKWTAAQERLLRKGLIRFMHDRGADAVHPAPSILTSRRGKGGAAYLLGIQAQRVLLRGVLADRERSRMRLGGKLVSKSRLIDQRGEFRHGGPLLRSEYRAPESIARKTASGLMDPRSFH